jgi:hypothetical protein
MKASLLARAASALLLTTSLVGGISATGYAQTTAAPTPPAATSPSGAPSGTASGTTSSGAASTAPATTHHTTMHHATHAQRRRSAGETMQQMAEQRIADLHKSLHITTAQQSQWDQFAQVMRDNAKDLDQAYQQRAATFDKMNAVDNMQSYAQIEQTRAQDMQKLVPAFQTLYNALSDQQKQEADALFRNQAAKAQARHAAAKH